MIETSNQRSGGVDFNGRHSASPARTIDSHDSTTGSMDTIVDRSLNREELHQVVTNIEQSTNSMSTAGSESLTNSHIGMLQRDVEQQQQEDQEQSRQDAQSHIYSSPVYDEKPPALKLLSAALDLDAEKGKASIDEDNKPKLISHKEFKQQLEEAMVSRQPNQVIHIKKNSISISIEVAYVIPVLSLIGQCK